MVVGGVGVGACHIVDVVSMSVGRPSLSLLAGCGPARAAANLFRQKLLPAIFATLSSPNNFFPPFSPTPTGGRAAGGGRTDDRRRRRRRTTTDDDDERRRRCNIKHAAKYGYGYAVHHHHGHGTWTMLPWRPVCGVRWVSVVVSRPPGANKREGFIPLLIRQLELQ